ncbi:hypothetical protein WSM22_00850 [Cytophagales bacterium WSM2-2]|nr:hypothetical protein WSM22_00850 [Cytophagales bacterium WSM2-2]
MVLKEFPNLAWLKQQIQERFESRLGWNGITLKDQGWPTVLMNVQTHGVFRDNIKGPLSLFGNLSGNSFVTIDNRKVCVDDDHFFISNSTQNYSLEIEEKSKTETFNIHFGDHFADELIQSQAPAQKLLDNQFQAPIESFSFYNRLLRKTKENSELLKKLQLANEELQEQELLAELFISLFQEELKLKKVADTIPSLKKSTREELIRRVLLGTDYLREFYRNPINLDDLAAASCMSKFHFLRLFKIATGQTPHQFLTNVRIEKSKELLISSNWEIKQIADYIGFQESSSFSRAFYQHVGVYPSQFRD